MPARYALLLTLCCAPLFLPGQYGCLTKQHPAAMVALPYPTLIQSTQPRSPVTIRMVVHVVWRNAIENISDQQIYSQVEALNEDFGAGNSNASILAGTPFAGLLTDTNISFELADTDPAGNPTTGITRTLTSVPQIGISTIEGRRRVCYTDLGGQDAWCPAHYLNVWVGAFPPGLAGEASFPGQDVPAEDGIRIAPGRLGRLGTVSPPYHLGRTLAHEVGHYLNLRHTWGSGAEDPTCSSDDGIADTPAQAFSYLGECPVGNRFSCGSNNLYQNYMNFTNDACMALFTPGQAAAMHDAITLLRPGLLSASHCSLMVSSSHLRPRPPQFRVWPNPSSAQVTMSLPAQPGTIAAGHTIRISDAAGRTVWQQHSRQPTETIATAHWPPGVYWITVSNGRQASTERLLLVRP